MSWRKGVCKMRSVKFKLVIDIMLITGLLLSMAYLLIGIDNHEIAGTVFFLLFIVHMVLNRRWFFSIFKGKYLAARILRTGINLLTLVMMVCLIISGLIFATYTPSVIKTAGSIDIARQLHLVSSYWCFILLSVHLGMNLNVISNAVKANYICREALRLAGIILACYGVYAFMKHDLLSYMFLQQEFVFFDMKQPLALFFADYISIMSFGSVVGYSLMRLSARLNICKMNRQMKTKEEME